MGALRVFLGVAIALAAGLVHAGNHRWTGTGPDGGRTSGLAFAETSPDTLLAASAFGGVFRSTDGGASWALSQRGLPPFAATIRALVWSSDGTRVYLAQPNRLYRSDDAGASWTRLAFVPPAGPFGPQISNVAVRRGNRDYVVVATDAGVVISQDGGITFGGTGAGLPNDPLNDVAPVAVATSSGAVYALLFAPDAVNTTHVYKSVDNGANWTPTADTSAIPALGLDIIVSASAPDVVHWIGQFGSALVRSADGGASWSSLPLPASSGSTLSVTTQPGAPNAIWLGTSLGVYYTTAVPTASSDWIVANTGLTPNGTDPGAAQRILIHPNHPTTPRWFAGTLDGGVYRTDTAGFAWSAANTGFRANLIRALAVHPIASNIVLAGQGNSTTSAPALFRSADSGASWPRANTGLNAEQVRALAIDPTTVGAVGTTVIYAAGRSNPIPTAANRDGGVYKSSNGGLSWSTIDSGIATSGSPATPFMGIASALALDPRSCAAPPPIGPCTSGPLQTVYVSGEGVRSAGTGNPYTSARVYKSTNAGASWTASETGLPLVTANPTGGVNFVSPFNALVLVPTSTATLYLGTVLQGGGDFSTATIANGVFVTTNGGATWSHASNGLPRRAGAGSSHFDVSALAVNPFNPLVLYASVFHPEDTAFLARLFKTIDGGANWFDATNGVTGGLVRAFAIDPSDVTGNTVYTITEGTAANRGGFFVSRDAGASWNSLSIGLADSSCSHRTSPIRAASTPAATAASRASTSASTPTSTARCRASRTARRTAAMAISIRRRTEARPARRRCRSPDRPPATSRSTSCPAARASTTPRRRPAHSRRRIR